MKKDPTSETGITRIGISVALQLRKKKYMIITTRANAIKMVSFTSLIDSF